MDELMQIGELVFALRAAIVDCFVEDGQFLRWGLQVTADDLLVEGAVWEPQFTSEVLFTTVSESSSPWQDLLPESIEWGDTRADDEPNALVYVFEHIPLYEGRVTFDKGGEAAVTFSWSGKCDLRWKGGYQVGVPVFASGAVTFGGVLCGRMREAESRGQLGGLLDQDALQYVRDGNGVARLAPRAA